jgi:hypothetical protein
MTQVALKPEVIFKAIPGYCSPFYRGFNYNTYESVEGSNVICVWVCITDCIGYGRILKLIYYIMV